MKKLILSLAICLYVAIQVRASKETFMFSVKGNDTLFLDKYDTNLSMSNKPCIVFVFGGGFAAGNRASESYLPFFDKLTREGYVVISVDYRLGLKNVMSKIDTKKSQLKILDQFASLFENAVIIAVEDLFDATSFILKNASEWGINKQNIVACGSSAGAIAVLQGEYELCNNSMLTNNLPDDFRYAGIISFAGAIYSKHGGLTWQSAPAPIHMFHDDADRNVPYDKLKFRKLGLYGSKHIAAQLNQAKTPHYFYSVRNTAHEVANTPMSQNWNEIKTFLDKFVVQKQNLIINTDVNLVDKPELSKKMSIKPRFRNRKKVLFLVFNF